MRFSAVKLPCDSGEGRVKRGAGEGLDEDGEADVEVGEVAVVGTDGVMPEGRVEVAVAVDDDEEADAVRMCGGRGGCWLVLGDADRGGGGGVLRAEVEVALEPVLLRDRLARGTGAGML